MSRKWFVFLCVAFLGILQANELVNGGFEEGTRGWTVKGAGEIDTKVYAVGNASMRITLEKPVWQRIFQGIQVEPNTKYQVEYLVKYKDVVAKPGAKYGGPASWLNTKKPFPRQGIDGTWKLNVGSRDWTKVSYTFTTGSEDKRLDFQMNLGNASGTVWFDDVKITKIGSTKPAQAISTEMYPLRFLKQAPFRIAENLPGTIALKARSSIKSDEQGILLMEVPDFIVVTGGAPSLATAAPVPPNNRRLLHTYKVNRLPDIQRNGKTIRRYQVLFDKMFNRFLNAGWYSHHIFLTAEKNSAGRKGEFTWQVQVGKSTSAVVRGSVEITPPVIHTAPPCRQFSFMLPRSPLLFAEVAGHEEIMEFWKKIADERYHWVRACDEPAKGFIPIVEIGGVFWDVIPAIQPSLNKLKKELPPNITDKGKPGVGRAIWSQVDDASGSVDRFFREALRETVKLHPEAKDIVWDFEPHPYGYDEGGRARFARKLGLSRTPFVEEINSKHRTQWFNYMVELHAEYIRKFSRILKEEQPNLRFWYCSDPLIAASASHISSWCGIDVRLSDSDVDVHHHMPYYTGTRFFDDIAFNIASLKKPFYPLIDPAEKMESFYVQYTPEKVLQNILAVAALGGRGIGFWPDDAFVSDYFKAISDGFGMIAENEDFFFKGKRIEKEFTFQPVNAIQKTVKDKNGKEHLLYFPDFPRTQRVTVHQWNGDALFTLFNYNEEKPALWKISGRQREFYAEVPASGVICFRLSNLPEQKPLLQKIQEQQKRGSEALQEIHSGKNVMEWCAGPKGEPYFKISNGSVSAWIDLLGSADVEELFDASDNPLLHDGFAGKVSFYDKQQRSVTMGIEKLEVTPAGPQLLLKGVVGPYAGANPTPNPLLGMEVRRLYRLEKNALCIELAFRNPTDKAMSFGFRCVNFPFPGKRFGADKAKTFICAASGKLELSPKQDTFTRSARKLPFSGHQIAAWDGDPVEMRAEMGAMREVVRLVPDSAFAGIYFWFSEKSNTVEFLTDTILLKPRTEQKFTYRIEIQQ